MRRLVCTVVALGFAVSTLSGCISWRNPFGKDDVDVAITKTLAKKRELSEAKKEVVLGIRDKYGSEGMTVMGEALNENGILVAAPLTTAPTVMLGANQALPTNLMVDPATGFRYTQVGGQLIRIQ